MGRSGLVLCMHVVYLGGPHVRDPR